MSGKGEQVEMLVDALLAEDSETAEACFSRLFPPNEAGGTPEERAEVLKQLVDVVSMRLEDHPVLKGHLFSEMVHVQVRGDGHCATYCCDTAKDLLLGLLMNNEHQASAMCPAN